MLKYKILIKNIGAELPADMLRIWWHHPSGVGGVVTADYAENM